MTLYQPGTRGRRTLFVQPGREFPADHFKDSEGLPKVFSVVFTEGTATVDDQLGQYLLDKGLAARTPFLLPAGVAA